MVNLSILISSSEVSGPGGLFDFNATLPLVAIQFVLLMLILNTILYSPLLTVIEERKEYILGNLAKASEILAQANELTTQYEQELSNVRKEAQLEITTSQKIHKEMLEIELNLSQKYIIQKKTRYLNSNRFEKIMQITNIFKNNIKDGINKSSLNKLKKSKSKYLMICDYGIDLFDERLISLIERKKQKKLINVQTNSLNYGFNLFNKYKNYSYLCLDEKEWKLGLNTHENIDKKVINLSKNKNIPLAVTKGKDGSDLIYKNFNYSSPSFVDKTIDTTGCGDVYFALTSLMIIVRAEKQFVPLDGNGYEG